MPTTIVGESGVSQVQNNTITQADLTTAILPLGVGQSWGNMTGVRTLNTDYVNDTGRPISLVAQGTSAGVLYTLVIGGVPVMSANQLAGATTMVTGIVPAGATYRVNGASGTVNWVELR